MGEKLWREVMESEFDKINWRKKKELLYKKKCLL